MWEYLIAGLLHEDTIGFIFAYGGFFLPFAYEDLTHTPQ